MKIDFYALRQKGAVAQEPDLEHELGHGDAVARAKCGQVVLVKVWLRTDGPADLEAVVGAIETAVRPLGLR